MDLIFKLRQNTVFDFNVKKIVMKKVINSWFLFFLFMGFVLTLQTGCKSDEPNLETITDIDGNAYHIVTIGTQTWMVENLKTTKYRDGTNIPSVTENAAWAALKTGACCDYNNEASMSKKYGKLYNMYAIADSRNLAPAGWHVANDSDWIILTTFLGGDSIAGGKLKETGTTHWTSPNVGATNEVVFTALPGGYRQQNGEFGGIGNYSYFWSPATSDYSGAFIPCYRGIFHKYVYIYRFEVYWQSGFSVRCVRDK